MNTDLVIGRSVHYIPSTMGGPWELPVIVTRVHDDGSVNLTVLGGEEPAENITSVYKNDDIKIGRSWHWPSDCLTAKVKAETTP